MTNFINLTQPHHIVMLVLTFTLLRWAWKTNGGRNTKKKGR